jgi:curved DNA-binding protein CbpA
MPALPPDQLATFVQQMYGKLDDLSYYELLGVSTGTSQPDIRAAFYRVSGDLHPDRYHALADRELKDRLETIYARICEGYRVLTLPDKRAAYARTLAEGKKRLTSTERESNRPQNPEDSIKHEEAKKFFRLGMLSLGRKDFKGAVLNFNFARSFEPDAAIIKQKLGEAQAAQGATAKPGGAGAK